MRVAEVSGLRGELFDQRANRLIIPLGDFGDEVPNTAFGAVSEFATAVADNVQKEMNKVAPEMVAWWSAPTLPYGPARARKADQAMLGVLPNAWFTLVGGLVEAGLGWCDRVVLFCSTEEQVRILRENIPLLRESGRQVVFCFIPWQDITTRLVDSLVELLWDDAVDSSGELSIY